MQLLRTIFWVLTAVIVVVFAMSNWTPVDVWVWPNTIMQTKLPILILGAYALGLLPAWLLGQTAQWNLRRRHDSVQRELNDMRAARAASEGMSTSDTPYTPPSNL